MYFYCPSKLTLVQNRIANYYRFTDEPTNLNPLLSLDECNEPYCYIMNYYSLLYLLELLGLKFVYFALDFMTKLLETFYGVYFALFDYNNSSKQCSIPLLHFRSCYHRDISLIHLDDCLKVFWCDFSIGSELHIFIEKKCPHIER